VSWVGPVEQYLSELRGALAVRGAQRRRFLAECRDHLVDAAAERGPEEAVRAFGPPVEVAAAYDAEVASGRGVRSTFATACGVLATGASTLALIGAASTGATAPVAWAVVFFVAAQLAAVAAGLALVQALVLRRRSMLPAQVALLARRNGCALVAAGVTLFSAGAALPGRGSGALILAGPALLCAAAVSVLRARALARRVGGGGAFPARPPLEDLGRLLRLPVPALDDRRLLLLTTCAAAAAAFVRDRAEQGAVSDALVSAGVEGLAVVGCFLVLGRFLGLRRR
jgi:hypothetical protein